MRILTILGEILPVLGTVALLGLWLYQQTEVEQRSGELRQLAAARAVYQNYQSNNALFNAINEVVKKDEEASKQLRVFQTYNYELGLKAIEDALPESEKSDIPKAPWAYDSSLDVATKMELTQKRLEKLQERLAAREGAIGQAASKTKRTYLRLFLGLSLMSVIGAICKIVVKLASP